MRPSPTRDYGGRPGCQETVSIQIRVGVTQARTQAERGSKELPEGTSPGPLLQRPLHSRMPAAFTLCSHRPHTGALLEGSGPHEQMHWLSAHCHCLATKGMFSFQSAPEDADLWLPCSCFPESTPCACAPVPGWDWELAQEPSLRPRLPSPSCLALQGSAGLQHTWLLQAS